MQELEGPDGRETVRLQRNALTVVAWPTGDESVRWWFAAIFLAGKKALCD